MPLTRLRDHWGGGAERASEPDAVDHYLLDIVEQFAHSGLDSVYKSVQVQVRLNPCKERGPWVHNPTPTTGNLLEIYSCWGREWLFSENTAAARSTILHKKTTHPRIFGQHKLVLAQNWVYTEAMNWRELQLKEIRSKHIKFSKKQQNKWYIQITKEKTTWLKRNILVVYRVEWWNGQLLHEQSSCAVTVKRM